MRAAPLGRKYPLREPGSGGWESDAGGMILSGARVRAGSLSRRGGQRATEQRFELPGDSVERGDTALDATQDNGRIEARRSASVHPSIVFVRIQALEKEIAVNQRRIPAIVNIGACGRAHTTANASAERIVAESTISITGCSELVSIIPGKTSRSDAERMMGS